MTAFVRVSVCSKNALAQYKCRERDKILTVHSQIRQVIYMYNRLLWQKKYILLMSAESFGPHIYEVSSPSILRTYEYADKVEASNSSKLGI